MTSRGTIAVLVALAVFLYLIRAILFPFVLAGAIAYVATPGIEFLARATKLPRALWAVSVFFVLVATVGGLAYLALPAFAYDALQVVIDLKTVLAHALSDLFGKGPLHLLGRSLTADQVSADIVDGLRRWASQRGAELLLAGWGFSAIAGLILTLVVLFYFLLGGRALGGRLFALVPPHQRPLVDRIWAHIDPVLKRYFIGIAVVVLYAMGASYVGLGLVLGLSHALLLAILTGLLEMIPVIGPIASALLAGLVALHHATSIWNVLAYIVYATLLRLSIDEFVGPIVLGRASYIPPVLVIFCFLAGGLLFGVTGIIMAVPIALSIRIALATLYDEFGGAVPPLAVAHDSS